MLKKIILVGLAAAVLMPTIADAKPRPRLRLAPPLHGNGQGRSDTLSAAALDACVTLQSSIDAGASALETTEARMKAWKEDVERRKSELDQRKPAVDLYSQASVDAYNGLVRQYEGAIDAYNAQLPSHQADVDRHNARVDDFNARCAGRPYRQSDMDAIQSRSKAR
jgi:hypothetical protein